MNQAILLLVFGFINICYATRFSDCGSVTGKVNFVEVTNCPDNQDICILKKGTTVEVKVHFTPKVRSQSLTALLNAEILDTPVPLPLAEPDACKTGISCPVEKGKSYTYQNSLEVLDFYPEVELSVKLELKDDQRKNMVCGSIKCKIQSN